MHAFYHQYIIFAIALFAVCTQSQQNIQVHRQEVDNRFRVKTHLDWFDNLRVDGYGILTWDKNDIFEKFHVFVEKTLAIDTAYIEASSDDWAH